MKLIILKDQLNKGLSIVEKIAGKNLTLPILSNVLMETEKNFLKLSTTDLELGINYWLLTKIEKEGKTAVPVQFLSNFISSLPDKKMTLVSENKTLQIYSENCQTQINTQNPEEFPIIPKIKSENFIEVNISPFYKGISQVIDFTSQTQIRPELSGIYFNFQPNSAQFVATDSFRLAEKTLHFEKKISFNQSPLYSFILPHKTARELINILNNQEGKLRIYFSPNQVLFETSSSEFNYSQFQLISRLIEGEYPNYQEIIPSKKETQLILSRKEFLNQLKTASLFSRKVNEVKIKTQTKPEGIEIFSQDPEIGQNKSFLPGKIQGKTGEISFNFRFLIDGLNNIQSSEIIFELNSEAGPAVLRPVGDTSYLYVVMPIKST